MCRFKFGLVCLVAMVALSGCTHGYRTGNEITQEHINKLVIGETTVKDMTALLGPPVGQGYDSSGKMMMTWIYIYTETTTFPVFEIKTRNQSLAALFDENGILEKFNITENPDAGPTRVK